MVDILLATFNGEKYIREQLDSLLSQTYKDIRIMIHDDGSGDGTVDVIKEYVESFPSKIEYIDDGCFFGNPGKNFAHLLAQSTAEYVMFSDQDDVWDADKVRLMLAAMKAAEVKYGVSRAEGGKASAPEGAAGSSKPSGGEEAAGSGKPAEAGGGFPLVVFSDYEVVDENLNPLKINEKNLEVAKHYTSFNRLIVQNYVSGCTMMINRCAADMFGEYDDRMDMHDWWIALYTSAMGKVVHFPKKLMLYRQHSENEVGAKDIRSFRYCLEKLKDPAVRDSKEDAYSALTLMKERYRDRLPKENRRLIDDFLRMKRLPKRDRVKVLLKYKILKSDLVRTAGQLFYI